MKIKKRHVVLAVMVMVLSAAVYINWQFSSGDLPITETIAGDSITETSKELGEAQLVNNPFFSDIINSTSDNTEDTNSDADLTDNTDGIDTTTEKAETNNTSKESSEYFKTITETREKAREDALDIVKDVLANIKSNDAARIEAVAQAAEIAKNIELEANIESLLKAKNFDECIAFIQNGECSIAVKSEKLLDSQIITIKDVVNGQSNIAFDKIKIIEVQ